MRRRSDAPDLGGRVVLAGQGVRLEIDPAPVRAHGRGAVLAGAGGDAHDLGAVGGDQEDVRLRTIRTRRQRAAAVARGIEDPFAVGRPRCVAVQVVVLGSDAGDLGQAGAVGIDGEQAIDAICRQSCPPLEQDFRAVGRPHRQPVVAGVAADQQPPHRAAAGRHDVDAADIAIRR